jgi:lysozyme
LFRLLLVLSGLGAFFIVLSLTVGIIEGFGPERFPFLPRQKSFSVKIPGGYEVLGIDVSRHQGLIDWKRVSAMRSGGKKIDFVFIKATEGITHSDSRFRRNWKEAKSRGLVRGAYHFYRPSSHAVLQAANFKSLVKLERGDLPPVVDIEKTNGKTKKEIVSGLKQFMNALESHYGVKPIIYTSSGFYSNYLKDDFSGYPLWISWFADPVRFRTLCPHDWHFWQLTDRARVDGIRGRVDFNVYEGSLEELQALCRK